MANDFEVSVDMAVPPATAWVLAGDPGRVHEWFDPVTSVSVEDDMRTVTMASGATLVERLVDRDDETMTYSYEVVSGIPGLTSHRATIRVVAVGPNSRVSWRQVATSDVEGYDIEARLSGIMTAGLEHMREMLEGTGG